MFTKLSQLMLDVMENFEHRAKIDYFIRNGQIPEAMKYAMEVDPRVQKDASTVKDYYHGYKFVKVFDNYDMFLKHGSIATGYNVFLEDLMNSCKSPYRVDMLNLDVLKDGIQRIKLGGVPSLCVAFSDEKDYTVIALRGWV